MGPDRSLCGGRQREPLSRWLFSVLSEDSSRKWAFFLSENTVKTYLKKEAGQQTRGGGVGV